MVILANCVDKQNTHKFPPGYQMEVEHISSVRLRHSFLEGLEKVYCAHLRGDIWKFLCRVERTKASFSSTLYSKFLEQKQPEIDAKIERDIHRTCPDTEEFQEAASTGENKLFNILKAYSQYDQEVGYVQGMNYVGYLLLKCVTDEEDAFWCLVFVMQERGWREIFGRKKNKIMAMLRDLEVYIQQTFPELHDRFINSDYLSME